MILSGTVFQITSTVAAAAMVQPQISLPKQETFQTYISVHFHSTHVCTTSKKKSASHIEVDLRCALMTHTQAFKDSSILLEWSKVYAKDAALFENDFTRTMQVSLSK